MSDEAILQQRHGHVVVLTLNRPDTRNALCEDMYDAFEAIFPALNEDLSVRAVILTGAGSAFCAGGNLVQMRDRSGMFGGSPEQIQFNYRAGIQRVPRAFARLDVPIIAAVNGPAIGAGNDLACMCDLRIAADSARFAESFVKVGIVPGDGGCWLLPRIVGAARAAEMILTGDALNAQQALRIGLVSDVVASEQLPASALALANRIAANPPQVLRWSKKLLRKAEAGGLDAALDDAGKYQGLAHHTRDHAEAVAAFFEKRNAEFSGQ